MAWKGEGAFERTTFKGVGIISLLWLGSNIQSLQDKSFVLDWLVSIF